MFAVPHPIFLHDAAVFFERHWDTLGPQIHGSPISVSKPEFPPDHVRAVRITPQSALPRHRLERLGRYRFCAVTDVARFYPSIYTHSIPWAVNGKVAAKNDTRVQSAAVFGNRLDFIVRQGQDRQTVGIPVGPDVSRII